MFIKGAEGRIWFHRGKGNHILVGQTSELQQDTVVRILNSYLENAFYSLLPDQTVIRKCIEIYENQREKERKVQ